MNKNDATVIKILTELGLRKEVPLTEEQEYELRYATDEEFRFNENIKRVFAQPHTKETE